MLVTGDANADLLQRTERSHDLIDAEPGRVLQVAGDREGRLPERRAHAAPARRGVDADVQQREVRVLPGETALAFYTATNKSDEDVIGVATYSVTPGQVAPYFSKIQCFCFEEQRLNAGETVDMPVFFYIDPEFLKDPAMKGIDTITLNYTFFSKSAEGLATGIVLSQECGLLTATQKRSTTRVAISRQYPDRDPRGNLISIPS